VPLAIGSPFTSRRWSVKVACSPALALRRPAPSVAHWHGCTGDTLTTTVNGEPRTCVPLFAPAVSRALHDPCARQAVSRGVVLDRAVSRRRAWQADHQAHDNAQQGWLHRCRVLDRRVWLIHMRPVCLGKAIESPSPSAVECMKMMSFAAPCHGRRGSRSGFVGELTPAQNAAWKNPFALVAPPPIARAARLACQRPSPASLRAATNLARAAAAAAKHHRRHHSGRARAASKDGRHEA